MPRRVTNLSDERRQALAAELRLLGELEQRATLDKYVHVSRAYDAGMSQREIGAIFGVSGNAVYHWKEAGERERERRRSGDPERPGESEPVG